LRLKDINFGTIGRDTPMVMLRQTSAYDPPSVFSLDNLTLIGDEYAALVQVEGQSWRGEVSTVTMDPVYPQVLNMGAGRGVVSRDNRLTGPPRSTRWTAGAHVLDVMSPVDGQFSQWRCPASGEYGTPTPPTWQGFEPLDAGANGLAAYVQGHSYWTAGPETRVGFSTEVIHAAALNRVFGGVPIPARGPLYLGISTRNASRTGFYRECSGPGYARVPVGPFVIDADGSARTVQSLTFPAAGADWTDLRSLFLIDSPSGWGNVVAMIGVEPFSVAAGSTLGFDAGVLKVAASRSRDQFASAMFRAIHDSAFNAAPLATPTLYVALSTGDANSSTAPVEPVGNGYARVPAPASSWTQAEGGGQFRTHQRGAVSNAVPLAFGVPSGSWGALRSVYLMDAASGGQVVASANLTIPRSPTAGGPAPTFSTGAFWVSLC
jgi:hypothetical protein